MKATFLTAVAMCLVICFGCQQDTGLRSHDDAISVRSDGVEAEDESADDWEEAQETEIDPSTLPRAITGAVESRYPGALIKEADKLTWADGSVTYDVEILFDGETLEPMFTASGVFLGEEDQD